MLVLMEVQVGLLRFVLASTTTVIPLAQLMLKPKGFERTPKPPSFSRMVGGGSTAVKSSVRILIAPVASVASSRNTYRSATSGTNVGLRIFAAESAAVEPDGSRISRHCQATAVCGRVSSWRKWATGPTARSIVGVSGQ